MGKHDEMVVEKALKIKILKISGFLLCLGIFLFLAVLIYFYRDEPFGIDAGVRDFFYRIRGEKYGFLYWFNRFITEFGNFTVVIVLLAIAFFKTKCDFRFFIFLFGIMMSVILCVGMKNIYARFRPDESMQWASDLTASFPSGHSAVSGFLYSFIIYVTYHTDWSTMKKHSYYTFSVVITILVVLSRMVLGMHYLTDCLAGVSLGIMVSCFCMLIFRYCLNNNILTTGLFERKKDKEINE